MKVYAKQTPPEWQESPAARPDWWDQWPGVYVYGNRDYNENAGAIYETAEALARIGDALEEEETPPEAELRSLIEGEMPRRDGRGYTCEEIKRLIEWVCLYMASFNDTQAARAALGALSVIAGRKYISATIRGSCQSEWQRVAWPEDLGLDALRAFEAEYFNTGSDWRCTTDDDETPLAVYCTSHDPGGLRAEIANAMGCKPGDVTLYHFDGWERSPRYREEAPR